VERVETLLREGEGRILAGPWLGEVGWEVLYWIPLLEWAVREWPELRSRLVVVSRGGVAGWYQAVSNDYVDLFELHDQDSFTRNLIAERESRKAEGKNRLKQAGETQWERQVAERVGARFGEGRLAMLHPSSLYSDPRAKKQVRAVAASAQGLARWHAPERGPLEEILPEQYVAVRFYASRLTKDEQGSQLTAATFADAATRALAERLPVVMLDPGIVVDPQHPDFTSGADVVRLAPYVSFANNLELQSIAIANAAAFVGTFGGLAFVAPRYGVPSLSFWVTSPRDVLEQRRGPWRDLAVASSAFNRGGQAEMTVRRYDEGPLDELLAPALTHDHPGTARLRRIGFASSRRRVTQLASDAASESGLAPVIKNPGIRLYEANVTKLLRESSGRIIAGPWLGEVGWEVLYWIPLLQWSVRRWPELRERLVAVSRGGVAGWYEGVAADYLDLFEVYDRDTFAARTRRPGVKALTKQRGETEWDLEIAEWVGARFGERRPAMLHPSTLYDNAGAKKHISALAASADGFGRWRRPARGPLSEVLPDRYVAVRFYGSTMTLDDERSQRTATAFAQAATRALAERVPVVLLNPGIVTDPLHPDVVPQTQVIELSQHMSFANNLGVQSIAIANSSAFVGTFGGLAFVPPYYGVPSLSFWVTAQRGGPEKLKAEWRDLAIAKAAFNRPGWGGLTARRYDEAPLDELLAPIVERVSEA
jgi:hypothetical protein